jgi:hypothetical protein
MAGHIFLSYRSIEADFALKLAADLKNAGVKLWMDRLDGIRGGDEWRRSIEEALTVGSCAAMIAAVSPDYVEAEYCRKELSRANRLKIPIFPVMLRPVPDDKIPLEIEGVQWLDLRDWQDEIRYGEKLSTLLKLLPDSQKGSVPDAETRYLTSLIAELESRRGVLEYVELAAETELQPEIRPQPRVNDEWGFSFLVDSKEQSSSEAPREPQKIQLRSIKDAVEKHKRFALIGEPGTGKTTTIRRLALEAARERLANPETAPIPLLLYLPQWSDGVTATDFIRSRWSLGGDILELLWSGGVHLYLDGLNEMGAQGLEKTEMMRIWFRSKDAPKYVIVTCRVRDYTVELKLDDMPIVLIQELDEGQIRDFAVNYLKGNAQIFLNHILPTSKRKQSLLHLARNPYMLGALAFIYEHSPSGELPHNTGELFRKLAQALWERERLRGTSGWIPFEQAEAAYSKLAYTMIDEDQPIDVPIEYVLKYGVTSSLLMVGLSANYVIINGNHMRFYHQLMQEYFTAVELERHQILKVKKPSQVFFGLSESRWDKSIVAQCGICQDANDLVQQIAYINIYLAADCIASGTHVSNDITVNIIKRLSDRLTGGIWLLRRAAADSLSKFSNAEAMDALLMALQNNDPSVSNIAADAIGKIDNEYIIPALSDLLTDKRTYVRASVVMALGNIGRIDILGLLETALKDTSVMVRRAVVDAIGSIGSEGVLDALQMALRDEDSIVRCAVLEVLGNMKAVDTTVIVKGALEDSNKDVRRTAARVLENINSRF